MKVVKQFSKVENASGIVFQILESREKGNRSALQLSKVDNRDAL